ncbi:serine/threonine-protein kinase [Candidatus Uabimicrobium amorphum]|uniref:non-specific serine/threonine protein kinase n=1 Tax=Uabimicrobium amorphum TaxID=2596890 RepID=A0A5S9IPN0_UABAM|nr:serine/threonine-protein kinase [Candidatus Uabimicrobium amorphum]BBM84860.1 protein kinase [Candidatus Uabimicrobium amorphum]
MNSEFSGEQQDMLFENLPNTRVFKTIFPKGSYIGPYQVIEEVGQGGMARVYRAYHQKLERFVAIKVMDKQVVSQEDHQRFVAEAKLTARLQHPNIVAVLDVGTALGLNYIVMDFIQGTSLRDIIQNGPLPIDDACKITKQIALGLHYAHNKGVIHRDIKPSNIIITKDNRPVIMDFGLAKNTKMAQDITKSGVIIGTPKYMAPEQIKGDNRSISRATDVYGLGTVFYEMLTGKPVVLGETPLSVSYSILNKEVLPPRNYRSEIPQDVQTICLKTLEKNKQKRYRSANALADDIARFLNGEAVVARQENKFYLLHKKAQRYRLWFFIGMCILLGLLNVLQFFFFNNQDQNNDLQEKYNKVLVKLQNLKSEYQRASLSQNSSKNMMTLLQAMDCNIRNQPLESLNIVESIGESVNKKEQALIFCYRAYFLISAKRYREARESLNQAISIDPSLSLAYFLRGKIFVYFKMHNNAIKDFEYFLTQKNDVEIVLLLCDTYLLEHRYTEAQNKLQDLIKLSPSNYRAYHGLAKCYLHQEEYNKAITYSVETLKKNRKFPPAFYTMGYAYYFLKQWDKSIQFFTRAEALDPTLRYTISYNDTFTPFFYFRGIAYKKQGFLREAFNDFSKGIRFFQNPSSTNRIFNLCLVERARLYAKNNKHTKAVEDYNTVRQNSPHLLNEEDVRYLEKHK